MWSWIYGWLPWTGVAAASRGVAMASRRPRPGDEWGPNHTRMHIHVHIHTSRNVFGPFVLFGSKGLGFASLPRARCRPRQNSILLHFLRFSVGPFFCFYPSFYRVIETALTPRPRCPRFRLTMARWARLFRDTRHVTITCNKRRALLDTLPQRSGFDSRPGQQDSDEYRLQHQGGPS